MSIYRMQCSWQMDTTFPRDALVITPHFKDSNIVVTEQDAQGLVDDLAAGLRAWDTVTAQLTVKAYDAESPAPNFPVAEKVLDVGAAPASSVNREVAVCLSFFAGQNRPRQRGRVYVPCNVCGLTTGGPRPGASALQKAADLVPIFTGLGGIDVDWVVWSRADQQARSVTNWWVDNAWDIQRRRGLPASSRLEGTTSEA